MGRPKGSPTNNFHKWSEEEKEYLRKVCSGNSVKYITELMNNKFDYDFKESQVSSAMFRNGLSNGLDGSFKKGEIPWNKGTVGVMKPNSGSFVKGNRNIKERPLLSERIDRDGYVNIKVGNPSDWKLKHRWIYEKHYGEIGKGKKIIFLDGDKRNFNIDNLAAVEDSEMLILNTYKLIYEASELTKVGLNIAKVIDATRKINKK